MSFEQATKNIQGHIAANFTGLPLNKIAWDNVTFEPVTGEAWVRVSIQHNIGDAISTGGPNVKIRRPGIVFFQIC
jgi:hypothetical protein